MVIPGMAELDYDDTDGYGPENISIETTAPAGSYKLLHTHVFTADDVSVDDENPEATDWVVITLTAP
jgi:uncharacterized protein YfaP (DUF2135 family)